MPGTGTYAQQLFFVNFANWNTQTKSTGISCAGSALPMAAAISDTPDTLSFCLSVSATDSNGNALTGYSGIATNGCNETRDGYNDVAAVPLPTYTCPPLGEAYLGNNGFYTGVPGDPALYSIQLGSTAVVTMSNIEILSSTGIEATGWQLVTGDAESTDSGESLKWVSTPASATFTLLPNSPTSDIGNACNGAPPTNLGTLAGLGTTTVTCTASYHRDKTGTAMIEAQQPSTLTMTLGGGGNTGNGIQAVFVGVLL